MKIRNLTIWFTIALTLTACVAPAPQLDFNNPLVVKSAINEEYDGFKKLTTYNGPNISSEYGGQLFIRAWKIDGAKDTSYQIYVEDPYSGDWRFYNSAYDSSGNRLDTTLISRKVGYCSQYGCSKDETLGLNVTLEYLKKIRFVGVRFKVSGTAGEEVFYIPAGYIQGFLSAINGDKIIQLNTHTESPVVPSKPLPPYRP